MPIVGDEKRTCGLANCQEELQPCNNNSPEGFCNRWLVREGSRGRFCDYCELTAVIPDLSGVDTVRRWHQLERAKQRVLCVVDLLEIPYRNAVGAIGVAFEFKEGVKTGHSNGCITINLREADEVEREKLRVSLGEPQRTLVGHLRHELGHYFWQRLVNSARETEFRTLFGDERRDYNTALAQYYDRGPADAWAKQFVSEYATSHPWEDFAETFAVYLDMVSVLDTACHFGLSQCGLGEPVEAQIAAYQEVAIVANEFNRDMGLLDLVPQVVVPAVVEKLRFIHSLRG